MNPVLYDMQKKQLLWRATHVQMPQARLRTSYQKLDKALNGGFPTAGLIHIKSLTGLGEVRLVLPAVKAKSNRQLCAFIAPPHLINAEFLLSQGIALQDILLVEPKADKSEREERLWSAEQCAKSGACHAVFLWYDKLLATQAKKLELAALKGECLLFVFDSDDAQDHPLPVSLALSLTRTIQDQDTLQIKVNKQKVGWPIPSFSVKVPFASKLGSPMQRNRRPSYKAANVYALHGKRS